MAYTEPARITTPGIRIRRIRLAALLVVVAVLAAALGAPLVASSPSPSSTSTGTAHRIALSDPQRDALGEADGAVPDGTTVFDRDVPGVAKLDPALLGDLRRAATDAARDGVTFDVDSGWRTPQYQEHLLRQAILKYGSEAAAERWVATPKASAHVSWHAVDVGPSGATGWLSEHGAAYGLCQIYANEPWHYERRPEAVDHGCPPMYADPTHDPRTQQ